MTARLALALSLIALLLVGLTVRHEGASVLRVERHRAGPAHGGGFISGPLPPTLHLVSSAPLPASYSLAKYIVRVHNQSTANSCVAQTLSAIEEITNRERGKHRWFSPGFLYSQRVEATGMSYDEAFGTLTREGDAPYAAWPDDATDDGYRPPSAAAIAAAAPFRFVGWRSIAPSDVGTIEAEIHAGRPLALAIPVYSSFLAKSDSSVVFAEYGVYEFMHSVTVIGYSAAGVRVLNSWGTSWADGGRATLSWGFLTSVNALIEAAYPQVAPKPKPKSFPLRKWSAYTRAHHLTAVPAYHKGHERPEARFWAKHEALLGYVKREETWHPVKRGRGYESMPFVKHHLLYWPSNHAFKVAR